MEQPSPQPHVWEYRWVRDLALIAVVALLLWAAYSIRDVIAPILIGAALAYVFNPLVTWAHQWKRVPRWASAATLLGAALLLVAIFFLVGARLLVMQTTQLLRNVPRYIENLGAQMGIDVDWRAILIHVQQAAAGPVPIDDNGEAMTTTATALTDYAGPVVAALAKVYAFVVWFATSLVGFVSYATVAMVIIAFCFFFFVWHWDPILRWFDQFIPAGARPQTLHVLRRMDRSVSAFIRGRLVQALVMGVILSVGWWMTGVPYWLLLGLGSGLLNLIPFAGFVGFIAAVVLSVVDHLSGTQTWAWGPLLWPALVYGIAQMVDGWVVEPIVQGKATDLDPLTVLLAVLIGGSLAGLLGLILAIPIAACVKILGQELIVPKLRAFAAEQ